MIPMKKDAHVNRAAVPPLLQKSYVDESVAEALKAQHLSVASKIPPTVRQMEVVSQLGQSMFVQTTVKPHTHHSLFQKGHPLRADFEGALSEN